MTLAPDRARALTRAARAVQTSTEQRNALIYEAKQSGASLREIAAVAGVSNATVMRIVERMGK